MSSIWRTSFWVKFILFFQQKLNNQLYSVEKLLELNQEEISKLVYKNEGDSEDNRKLSSALEQLKNFRGDHMIKICTNPMTYGVGLKIA